MDQLTGGRFQHMNLGKADIQGLTDSDRKSGSWKGQSSPFPVLSPLSHFIFRTDSHGEKAKDRDYDKGCKLQSLQGFAESSGDPPGVFLLHHRYLHLLIPNKNKPTLFKS